MWGPKKHRARTHRPARLAIGVLSATMAIGAFAPGIAAASERTPGDVEAEEFVRLQYNDFLARQPDAGGLAFWATRIDDGVDLALLIESMVDSPEFSTVVAPMVRLYQAHLGRAPDYDGLVFWSGQLSAGRPLTSISEHFSRSAEFTSLYGSLTDVEYVELVYQNVLGRGADAGGRAFWVDRLSQGVGRGEMMAQFSESPEFVDGTDGLVKATMLYLGLLRRVPDAGGLEFWAGRIDGGMLYRTAMHGFLYSPEYQQRLGELFPASNPLTGEATSALRAVPALAVKIDNVANARPQVGLNEADIVIEEMVEGSFTRLIAVFQSDEPAHVGPVRSIRTTDFDVLSMFNTPLLAASGANAGVLAGLDAAPIINVNALVVGSAYFRAAGRRAPHNMFLQTAEARAFAAGQGGVPGALFAYHAATEPFSGAGIAPSGGVAVDFGNQNVAYAWDAGSRSWIRSQNGSVHNDADGRPASPTNLVVLDTQYRPSAADAESPEAITVGSGVAHVFSAGQVVTGTWERAAANQPYTLRDAAGAVIELATGTTWVELAPPGSVTLR